MLPDAARPLALIAVVFSLGLNTAQGQTLFVPGGTAGASGNGNVGIGTAFPAQKLTIQGGHGDTSIRLFSDNYGQGTDGVNTALLSLWASEPGWTWGGVGIGNNVINSGGIVRATDSRGGSYIRLLDNTMYLSVIDSGGNDRNGITINPYGNVGIGTTTPNYRLEVSGGPLAASRTGSFVVSGYDAADLVLGSNAETRNGYGQSNGSHIMLKSNAKSTITALDEGDNLGQISYQNLRWTIGEDVGWGTQRVLFPGNVGIGTTNPTHKLAVNGTIKAKEVIVETTGWSDYVFADDYALAPLAEVEAHIKEHKHLPGIPSAAQVAEQGVSVGDMQARLLAKIEELTLHQIAQEKRLAAIEAENARLKAQLR